MAISVLIVDDHPVIHHGIAYSFSKSDIQIAGNAYDGLEAINSYETLKPDIVIMDVRIPQQDGLQTLEKLKDKHPDIKVIMYSAFENPTYIARFILLNR